MRLQRTRDRQLILIISVQNVNVFALLDGSDHARSPSWIRRDILARNDAADAAVGEMEKSNWEVELSKISINT
jgi:hypothetical protein